MPVGFNLSEQFNFYALGLIMCKKKDRLLVSSGVTNHLWVIAGCRRFRLHAHQNGPLHALILWIMSNSKECQ